MIEMMIIEITEKEESISYLLHRVNILKAND